VRAPLLETELRRDSRQLLLPEVGERRILHEVEDLDRPKVFSGQARLERPNPDVQVVPHHVRLERGNVADLVARYELVIEGSDNPGTKFLVNDACVAQDRPLVVGAADLPSTTAGRLLLDDAAAGELRAVAARRGPACPACGEAGTSRLLPCRPAAESHGAAGRGAVAPPEGGRT
jgi:hypothetical protein